jgi:hypothetical protein
MSTVASLSRRASARRILECCALIERKAVDEPCRHSMGDRRAERKYQQKAVQPLAAVGVDRPYERPAE